MSESLILVLSILGPTLGLWALGSMITAYVVGRFQRAERGTLFVGSAADGERWEQLNDDAVVWTAAWPIMLLANGIKYAFFGLAIAVSEPFVFAFRLGAKKRPRAAGDASDEHTRKPLHKPPQGSP